MNLTGVLKMSKTRVVELGMIFAYSSFLVLFSTSFFIQELMNGNLTGQLFLLE